MVETVNKVKVALRLKTNVYDCEIQGLIEACIADLQITDIYNVDKKDALILRAIITYCKMNFGVVEDGEYSRLNHAYNQMKAQLSMSSKYTKWDTTTENTNG